MSSSCRRPWGPEPLGSPCWADVTGSNVFVFFLSTPFVYMKFEAQIPRAKQAKCEEGKGRREGEGGRERGRQSLNQTNKTIHTQGDVALKWGS